MLLLCKRKSVASGNSLQLYVHGGRPYIVPQGLPPQTMQSRVLYSTKVSVEYRARSSSSVVVSTPISRIVVGTIFFAIIVGAFDGCTNSMGAYWSCISSVISIANLLVMLLARVSKGTSHWQAGAKVLRVPASTRSTIANVSSTACLSSS